MDWTIPWNRPWAAEDSPHWYARAPDPKVFPRIAASQKGYCGRGVCSGFTWTSPQVAENITRQTGFTTVKLNPSEWIIKDISMQ